MIKKVKWLNEVKGYGFIETSNKEDIFAHYSVIEKGGYKALSEGVLVQCELIKKDKGLQAKKVLQASRV